MKYLFILFIVCCTGCANDTNSRREIPDDSITFIWTNKDTASIQKYGLQHEGMLYRYTKPGESFSLLYDSARQQWLFRDKYDSSALFLEKEEVFTVNSTYHTISKLILNKGVTDGEMTYIVDNTAGLLVMRSNTWRRELYYKTDDLQMSALILRIVTDEEFYPNANDTSGVKFTMPSANY